MTNKCMEKYVYIKDVELPNCCNDCFALDDNGDYPMCIITGETRGYTFNVREQKMDRCPLISADRPKGEWVDEDGNKVPLHKDGYPLGNCYCNQCHEWLVGSDEYATKGNFCPNCGADMRGDKHE